MYIYIYVFCRTRRATRQGHRRCAEILAHASSKPAREEARVRKEVSKCLSGIIDTISREGRQNERVQNREQKEVADVVRTSEIPTRWSPRSERSFER